MTNELSLPEDPNEVLDSLRYDDAAPVPTLPSSAEIEKNMVPTSFKWTTEMRDRVREVSAGECITAGMLIRRYIEEGLARDLVVDRSQQLISVDDAIRAATRALSSLKHSA